MRQLLLTLCFTIFCASWSLAPTAWAQAGGGGAGSFAPGSFGGWFHHYYDITNNGACDVTISTLTKSWNASTPDLLQVEYRTGSFANTTSGSQTYALSPALTLSPGQSVFGKYGTYIGLNFQVNPSTVLSQIDSTLSFTGSGGCGCSFTSASVTTTVQPVCGNTFVESGEQCEPPNVGSCNATCQNTGSTSDNCGDGVVTPPEQCEPPNVGSCNATCQNTGSSSSTSSSGGCNDGVVTPPEQCEPPNTATCNSSCMNISGSSSSSTSTSSGGVCGDGFVNQSSEQCEPPNTANCNAACQNTDGGSSSGGCNFFFAGDQACDAAAVVAAGKIPTVTDKITNGKVKIQLEAGSDPACYDPSRLCVQVRDSAIVGAYRNDPPASWSSSECLDLTDRTYGFNSNNGSLTLPVQHKTSYEVIGSLDQTTPQSSLTGGVCYFDTRIPPIKVIGIDRRETGDTSYAEARNLMNPNIAELLQPFEELNQCRSVCGKWLCGCDATGSGVVLESLESNASYRDSSNTSPAPNTIRPISRCTATGRPDVIYFDPNGGSVTLDAPGDTFTLPDYPVTLVVKGADLQIADNLKYTGSNSSLGVILLENHICGGTFGGGAVVAPEPTNLVGAYYLEGSVRSGSPSSWALPTQRNLTSWYWNLRNQLYWEGTIISRNTIEGTVDPTNPVGSYPWPRTKQSRCPSNITAGTTSCDWSQAVKYDLAYLREYFHYQNNPAVTDYPNWNPVQSFFARIGSSIAGGLAAQNAPVKNAVVIKYDGRIQSNPPPGFAGIADVAQREIGL